MNERNYVQIREAFSIFQEAYPLDIAHRDALLEQRCGHDTELREMVDQLLRNDSTSPDADTLIGAGPQALADELASNTSGGDMHNKGPNEQPHRRIGRYKILRKIGEGGMGIVYEAEQDQPKRNVALKVISPHLLSARVRQRFELEAQVLARVQHPGIAQIYDAGTAEGDHSEIPFIAMELIRGASLSAHIREQNPSTEQRLTLFVRICRAVEHAHRHGVIHRDLKPGNILVDSTGAPKILDFGIARLAGSDDSSTGRNTTAGQMLGTVPYMSPEQIAGKATAIDTRTDVYALGVILYEMLGDRLPYDVTNRSVQEAAKIITETEAPRLGSIHRSYRGDLETIVSKALERDQQLRYGTVSDLSADVERYLNQRPILARPPSAAYQLRKLMIRHKLSFVFATSLFILSFGSAIWLSVLYSRALTAELHAEAKAETARQTSSLLVDLFKMTNPSESRGRSITVAEVLDRGALRVQTDLQNQPEVRAELQYTLGMAYRNLGLYEEAQPLLTGALKVYRGFDKPVPQLADALAASGILLEDKGEYLEAERLLREALRIRQIVQPEAALLVANDTNTLAGILARQSRNRESLKLYHQALDLRRPILGEEHADIAETLQNLGVVYKAIGSLEESQAFLRQALAIQERVLPQDHPSFISTYYNLGEVLREIGALDESRNYYERALQLDQHVHGVDHPHFAISLDGLGKGFFAVGRYDKAESLFQRSLDMHRRIHKVDHPNIVIMLNNVAEAKLMLGKIQEAKADLLECAAMAKRVYGSDSPQTAIPINNVSLVHQILGEYEKAYETGLEALAIKRSAITGDHASVADTLHDLGAVQLDRGHLDNALLLTRQGLDIRRRLFGESHQAVGQSLTGLAQVLSAMKDSSEAESQMRLGLSVLQSALGEKHPDVAHGLYGLGKLLLHNGDAAAAEPYLRQAYELRKSKLPKDHWQTMIAASLLGESLTQQSRFSEAEPLLRQSADTLVITLGANHPKVIEAVRRVAVLP